MSSLLSQVKLVCWLSACLGTACDSYSGRTGPVHAALQFTQKPFGGVFLSMVSFVGLLSVGQ